MATNKQGGVMQAGVYRHKQHPELYYLLIGLAHHHDTKEEIIVYVSLFTRDTWSGVPRMTYRTVEDFFETFEWAGERQP